MKINTITIAALLMLALAYGCQRDVQQLTQTRLAKSEESADADDATSADNRDRDGASFPHHVLVYRHHPTYIPNLAVRQHDDEFILKTLDESGISYFSHGSLGREGSQIEIDRDDIDKWQELITKLIDSGKLKYYTSFGLDDNGHGFIDLPK